VSALANKEVGNYLNSHFVCAFQKVGTFQVVNGQKQGGNVVSYFCTPKQGVLDAIPGPVDAATFLREARWVVETRKLALLDSGSDMNRYKRALRLAHAQRLPQTDKLAGINWPALPLYQESEAALTSLLKTNPAVSSLDKLDRAHLLLAAYPLVKLDQAYRPIYEEILNEKVSTRPVLTKAQSTPQNLGHSSCSVPVLAQRKPACAPDLLDPLQKPGPVRSTSAEMLANDRRQLQIQELNTARNNPPSTMIYSGKALNTLLADLVKRQADGSASSPVPLNTRVLDNVNVASEEDGQGGGNFGLLKHGGKLAWPLVWRAASLGRQTNDLRVRVAGLIEKAMAQIRSNQEVADTLAALHGKVDELRALLKKRVNDLPTPDYLTANRYLGELEDGLTVLGQGNAAAYVVGKIALDPHKIKTVQDLVQFMSKRGLKFAPSLRGEEGSYVALQRCLALADQTGQSRADLDNGEL
jgi:hypothetical protein